MEKIAANDTSGEQKKRIKKRKRHIYNSIRQQMEFYFGNSNLQKDRFMKKLIEEKGADSFVPLEVFLTFNKIKSLTDTVEKIAKALTESELLELDETKSKVRRKTPFNPDDKVDDRTIYVEAIPSNVDHDWMKNMFKRFGKVSYVSLPKYPNTRKPKDFGFIEFENEKSVESALKVFRTFNGVLCTETTDPANLASILSHKSKKDEIDDEENDKKAKKRTMPTDVETTNSKRPKLDATVKNESEEEEQEQEEEEPEEDGEESSGASVENDECKKENATEIKKKRRKHKKSAEKRKKQLELTTDASFYELKILPKREWKRLRNRYLNLQRTKTSELKRAAAKERQQQLAKENASANAITDVGSFQAVGKKSKHEERRMHKMKMNFYGAVDAEAPIKQALNKNAKNIKAETKISIKFDRGLIVEVHFDKPCVDVKDFKKEVRKNKSVKYVDVSEGAMVAFLRLETPEAAENYIKTTTNPERKYNILKGEAEIEYFEKIERDRQLKLNKEIKVPSKRGREKVKATLAKHIIFNDENVD